MTSTLEDVWGGAKATLGAVAPMLATALGGPLAGTAVGAIVNALGLNANTPTDQVAAAISSATPDQLLALKQAEASFQEQMKKLDVDAEKLGFDDRANARQREVALRDKTPMFLAVAVTFGFFGLLGVESFITIPVANQAVLNILVGALAAGWVTLLGYYFGSSSSSRDKDETINIQAGK